VKIVGKKFGVVGNISYLYYVKEITLQTFIKNNLKKDTKKFGNADKFSYLYIIKKNTLFT